mmetsp:Transcript_57550/g.120346  ORF Transcript_57550/g.120346 Transcript_57550/m.120346 type:complete len:236 (-) Transcript_57550:242-949(-)
MKVAPARTQIMTKMTTLMMAMLASHTKHTHHMVLKAKALPMPPDAHSRGTNPPKAHTHPRMSQQAWNTATRYSMQLTHLTSCSPTDSMRMETMGRPSAVMPSTLSQSTTSPVGPRKACFGAWVRSSWALVSLPVTRSARAACSTSDPVLSEEGGPRRALTAGNLMSAWKRFQAEAIGFCPDPPASASESARDCCLSSCCVGVWLHNPRTEERRALECTEDAISRVEIGPVQNSPP